MLRSLIAYHVVLCDLHDVLCQDASRTSPEAQQGAAWVPLSDVVQYPRNDIVATCTISLTDALKKFKQRNVALIVIAHLTSALATFRHTALKALDEQFTCLS